MSGAPVGECIPALLESLVTHASGIRAVLLRFFPDVPRARLEAASPDPDTLPADIVSAWSPQDLTRLCDASGEPWPVSRLSPEIRLGLEKGGITRVAGWTSAPLGTEAFVLLLLAGGEQALESEPIREEAGFVLRLIAFAAGRDQTLRELRELNATLEARVEERTRETRRQAAAMDATFEGMAILEEDRYVYMNPAHEAMYGYKRGELLGKTWTTLYDPEEVQRIEAVALPVVATRGHWTGETTGRRKDGTYFTADVGLTLTPDRRLVCACRDSSERRRQTEALARSQEQLALVIAATQDGFWDWSIPSGRLAVGDRWAEMLGYTPGELPGEIATWHSLLHPDDRDRVLAELQALLSTPQRVFQSEYRVQIRTGGWLWVEARGRVVEHDAAGRPLRAVGAHTDITRRRGIQDSLRRRTEELIEANAALARAARGRDEFLARVSHELRTPLASVLALTETLLEGCAGPLGAPQQRHIRTIEDSSHHLLVLINDVLDAAKLESGQMQVALQPCDANRIAEDSLGLVRPQGTRKRLHLEFVPNPTACQVIADPVRLRQMLVNLLSNAIKFTTDGGSVRVTVEADPDHVTFAVADTGIGIDPDRLATLFQPFMQVESGLDRRFGGAGLGLLIVQRFAELHSGSVSVASEPGRGSTFIIKLPSVPPSHPAPAQEPEVPAPLPPPEDAPRVRLLVIDDHAVNRQAIADYLEHVGFSVACAADGLSGLTQATLLRPSAIILDVQMPGMDGLEVTRRLRTSPDATLAAIPILGLTALAMPDDRRRCLDAGMTEYQSKPVPLRRLASIVRSLTHSEAGPGPGTASRAASP